MIDDLRRRLVELEDEVLRLKQAKKAETLHDVNRDDPKSLAAFIPGQTTKIGENQKSSEIVEDSTAPALDQEEEREGYEAKGDKEDETESEDEDP